MILNEQQPILLAPTSYGPVLFQLERITCLTALGGVEAEVEKGILNLFRRVSGPKYLIN